LKIALCSDYFHPKTGGITTHIENLARTLEKRGHEVVIITKTADFNDEARGLKVVRIKSLFHSSQTLDVPHIDEHGCIHYSKNWLERYKCFSL